MAAYHTQRPAVTSRADDRAPELAGAGVLADRVRWGPIWAGAIVTLPVFLVLQSFFFALGWTDLGFDAGSSHTGATIVSGILALVAFFVGGLTAGSSAIWGTGEDGLLHGVLTWALSVAVMVGFALLGGGALLGSLGNLLTQIPNLHQLLTQGANVDMAHALQVVRHTAGWTALALGLTAAAAGAGGVVGSRVWPRRDARIPAPR